MDNERRTFGDIIASLAKDISDNISSTLDTEKLSSDRKYLIDISDNFLKNLVISKAKEYDKEDIIIQIFFQISPDATPQLSVDEYCAGVCIENVGRWKIREHNLTHIKNVTEENTFFKWWYFECIRVNVPGWTRVYYDSYLELDVITHSTPVWSADGIFIGVLGIDINYNDFTSRINRRLVDNIKEDIEKLKNEQQSLGILSGLETQYLNVNTGELINNSIILQETGLHSQQMHATMELVKRASMCDATVLLQGETGVGKDYLAKCIHSNSSRNTGKFINLNCGALSESLIESELFGYGKGAFTGANAMGSAGYFEAADGGTLLLNEIGDLPLHLQVKLLNVIQDKEVVRIGETEKRKTDFRLIVASNKDLAELVEKGSFREDLYYRVNVLSIQIPPLRNRKADIYPLVNSFLTTFQKKYNISCKLSIDLVNFFMEYEWPGNIRELENLIERLVLTCTSDSISLSDLPKEYLNRTSKNIEPNICSASSLKAQKEEAEALIIIEAYKKLGSSYKVAEYLGISQTQAYKKIKKYVK